MYTLLVVLHLIVCLFLIFIVLIQSSKGAEIGAAFGGSNQTLFGSRGAATALTKITTIAAVLFMLTSLSLAVLAIKQGSIMPERKSVRESPSKPLTDSTTGPVPASRQGGQEKPAETGQTPAPVSQPASQQGGQEKPVEPVK